MRTMASWTGAVALVALAAGCDGGSGGLSVSTRSAATAAVAGPDGLSLSNGVGISRIRMAVRRISVEGGDAGRACGPGGAAPGRLGARSLGATVASSGGSGSGGSGSGGSDDSGSDDGPGAHRGEDGECELSFGPFDVDLAGSALSGIAFAFDAPVPAGTYRELAIRVNTVPAARAGGNPVLEALAAAHASILVEGWVEDAPGVRRPFTFSTPMEVRQKREGTISIGPGSNVTLELDPGGWFGGSAARLDPADSTAQGAILANIRASFRLLHDDDHDGLDDHGVHPPGHP